MKRKPITPSTIRNRYDAGSVRTLSAAFLLLLLLQLVTVTAQATVWRVNSDPEISSADFRRLSDAQEAASPGDTIYLEGSLMGYGAFVLTKRLTLIGPGYFLEENQADTTRANFLKATVGDFNVNPGAQGSVVMGLVIVGTTAIDTDSISFFRNKLTRTYIRNCRDVLFAQNYLYYYNSFNSCCSTTAYALHISSSSNIHIRNNILIGTGRRYLQCIDISTASTDIYIENNVIYGYSRIYNAIVTNNIFRGGGGIGGSSSYPNSYSHNMSHTSTFPNENGNQNGVDMTTVFTYSGSGGKYFELKPDSPAIGAGRFGADMGIFGGTDPYRLSGIAPLPTIIEVEVTEVGLPATQLDVTFKAKAND